METFYLTRFQTQYASQHIYMGLVHAHDNFPSFLYFFYNDSYVPTIHMRGAYTSFQDV